MTLPFFLLSIAIALGYALSSQRLAYHSTRLKLGEIEYIPMLYITTVSVILVTVGILLYHHYDSVNYLHMVFPSAFMGAYGLRQKRTKKAIKHNLDFGILASGVIILVEFINLI